MDASIASLMAEAFCRGYEMQAKKEEKEAEDIAKRIDSDALIALCTRFDNKEGDYPEHEHEGAAVLKFFEDLKDKVKEGRNGQMKIEREKARKEND